MGEFEQILLLAIAQLGDDPYGVTIHREIARRLDREVAIGAVYTSLGRLERKGYVRTWTSDPTPQRGGRAKRHFALTAAGRTALLRSHDRLARMWQGLHADLTKGRTR
jgi:PadR family transcriptional regulator PadR